jgi:hypothetical protein
MNATDSLRFLEHEASFCRSHDSHEALCLLLPAMLRALELEPMNGYEAQAFRAELKKRITEPRAPAESKSVTIEFKRSTASQAGQLWKRFV